MTATNQPSLEDVLDMLLAAYKAPTQEAVADFAERFPAYRADILDFAADWAEEEHLPIPEPLTDAQEARVFSRAQSFLQNMLHEHANPAGDTLAARASLFDLARGSGASLQDVAYAAGLDIPLVAKLNARSIRPETIRQRVARAIAQFLGVDLRRVIESWTGPPLAVGRSYLAQVKPVLPAQEDFDTAVANSSLSSAQKAALLEVD